MASLKVTVKEFIVTWVTMTFPGCTVVVEGVCDWSTGTCNNVHSAVTTASIPFFSLASELSSSPLSLTSSCLHLALECTSITEGLFCTLSNTPCLAPDLVLLCSDWSVFAVSCDIRMESSPPVVFVTGSFSCVLVIVLFSVAPKTWLVSSLGVSAWS